MLNAAGDVIYVGKAKMLRKRLSSYFQKRDLDWKTRSLVRNIAAIDVILVNNEVESLVLENNLIKRYRPRYNRMLMRDDTGYKYIVLTDEAVPRFVPFKKHWINKDLGEASPDRRFGPYPNGKYRDSLLDYICDHYKLRTCNPIPKRVCLRYHLGTCMGICEQHISLNDYLDMTQQALAFLRHPNYDVLRAMKQEMDRSVAALDFERAQRIKLQYEALEAALDSQIVERDIRINQDVLYFGLESVLLMRILQGAVLDMEVHQLEGDEEDNSRHLSCLKNLYATTCPDEIITNLDFYEVGTLDVKNTACRGVRLRNGEDICEYLRRIRGKKVKITHPQRGIKRRLLALAQKNYEYRAR
jgi:excinuclease ABC subunit C